MTVDMSAFSTEYAFDRNRSGRAVRRMVRLNWPRWMRLPSTAMRRLLSRPVHHRRRSHIGHAFFGPVADLRMQRIGRSIRRRRGRFA
jgi:hypothetical protein